MPNVCNVPNCENRRASVVRNNNVAVFSVPKGSLMKWEMILKCKLQQNYGVCQLHFNPSDIASSKFFRDENGGVIQEVSVK